MPSRKVHSIKLANIEPLIQVIRGRKVILDADLARIYGVTTKRLNEAVNRNRKKFPVDFMFRLMQVEASSLRSQIVASNDVSGNLRSQIATSSEKNMGEMNRSQIATGSKHRDPRFLPYAFTEEGSVMAANILNSPAAVRMSVFVVRAFLKMRSFLSERKGLMSELIALEKKLTERLDIHEAAIVDVLRRLMELLDPPPPPPAPPKRPIGFHVKV